MPDQVRTKESTVPIAAIETNYAGCHFRSRLEARWAVFFDHSNIRWDYEPQGYILSTGRRYLPDFHLLDLDAFVEVKGSEAALDKHMLRIAGNELPGGLIVVGPIPRVDINDWRDFAWPYMNNSSDFANDFIIFGMSSRKRRMCFSFDGFELDDNSWLLPRLSDEQNDRDAYIAARSARFEFGQSGA
jgi:hypothetical protein